MKKLLLILLIAMLTSCNQRKSAENSDQVATPTLPDFFDANAPRAQVLLLGVAHFKDANADRYKPKYSLDIMSDKRQKELNDLLTNLEMFNPTKIVLEVRTEQQHLLDSLYTEYLNGTFDLGPHERFQIGFKLAKRLHLKQLIAGDTRGNEYDYIVSDYPGYRNKVEEIAKSEGLEDALANDFDKPYTRLYEYLDSLKAATTISEFLRFRNTDSLLNLTHGHYLYVSGNIGVNNGVDYPVADNISGWWYNRNLRIVSNIRKAISNPEERVLVVFGAGHMPIIKHALSASPEIELIDVSTVITAN